MQASLLRELASRRFTIRARWETLLRAEPVTTPLALPDALVYLIDSTLDEIFAALQDDSALPRTHESGAAFEEPSCPCRRNPYLAYFAAAVQAMWEALILAQAASAPLDPIERDASLAELNKVMAQISRREIEAFCGVCQFRHLALSAHEPPLALQR